jgi:hypothetical protein
LADAWGGSWEASWGDSWGDAEVVQTPVVTGGSGRPRKPTRLFRDPITADIYAFEVGDTCTATAVIRLSAVTIDNDLLLSVAA